MIFNGLLGGTEKKYSRSAHLNSGSFIILTAWFIRCSICLLPAKRRQTWAVCPTHVSISYAHHVLCESLLNWSNVTWCLRVMKCREPGRPVDPSELCCSRKCWKLFSYSKVQSVSPQLGWVICFWLRFNTFHRTVTICLQTGSFSLSLWQGTV